MTTSLEILIIFVLIIINGIFSMYEMAMVSSRKQRLEQRVEDGDRGAATALELKEKPTRFLSTVQVGISLISILAGAFGGVRLATPLGLFFQQRGWFGTSTETVALVLVVVVITFFSIVLGELLPKRIALNNPEMVSSALSGVMKFLSSLTRPVINLLDFSTELGLKILGVKPNPLPNISEEEVKLLIEEGRESGVFEEAEQEMVTGVFRLSERRIDALMTPHTELVWIDLENDHETIIRELKESEYSRIPVARGGLDQVVGVVNIKELIGVDLNSPDFNLENYAREPLYMPENLPALRAFARFRETGTHQALVIDEFGGISGMVTLYDVLESIVGAIPLDESDKNQEIVERADGSWSLDGLLPIDELKEILDVDELPGEEKAAYQTLSGFVMNQLGSIPKIGQAFVWDHFRFEVVDMDIRRVDRVFVTDLNRQTYDESPSI